MSKKSLPDFFCVGAQKAGTTSLFDVLSQHPEVYMPEEKEAHFFDWDDRYEKGIEWYGKQFFSGVEQQRAIGTITPSYLFDERVPSRIHEALGSDIKLIFLFRHPADRAWSHYLMEKRRQHEPLHFDAALQAEESRIAQPGNDRLRFSYAARGRYSEQVARYQQYFASDKLLFLRFERDWVQNRAETVNRIQHFLGLTPLELDIDLQSNAAGETRSAVVAQSASGGMLQRIGKALVPSPAIRKKLRQTLSKANTKAASDARLAPEKRQQLMQDYFAGESQKLAQLTGLDLSDWEG